jgi:hypothetical protein
MGKIVKVFLIACVVANLAVPEKIVRYGACCYDEHGNLNCAHLKARTGEWIHGHSCCDPTEYQLRAGAPSAAQVELQISPDAGKSAAVIADVDLNAFHPAMCTTHLRWYDSSGPPQAVSKLQQSSRLNI